VRKIVGGPRCGETVDVTDAEIEAEAAALRLAYPHGSFIECAGCHA
jgi:hypothetical protein